MLRLLSFALFAWWQEEIGWEPNPVLHDHRGEEIALFVLGTGIVALIVIVGRLALSRRNQTGNRKMFD